MDFNGPVVLGDDSAVPYSDDRSYLTHSPGRPANVPLVDNCIFCSDHLFGAVSNTTGFRMLCYISFIYLMPILFLWSKYSNCIDLSYINLKEGVIPRNVAFLKGNSATRFSFGLVLALLLLFSQGVEIYCYVNKLINIYIFGSSVEDFVYDSSNGTFGGRDAEANGNISARGYEANGPYAEFSEWFGKLNFKLKYVHVFHHIRWFVMSILVVVPVITIFSTNLVSFKSNFFSSKYYVETMDFALGLMLPLACVMIFRCTVYPIYVIVVSILYRSNGYHGFARPPHSLTVLCLQDECPCNHLVKDQVSPTIKQNLEYHAAYLGFGKLLFVASVGVLFVFSFVSIVLM